MTQQHDPLFERDEQERHEDATSDLEQWLLDSAAMQQLFQRAAIPYQFVEAEGDQIVVTVAPQKNVTERVERLERLADGAWYATYCVRVAERRHVFVMRRRN